MPSATTTAPSSQANPFIKQLASSDRKIRDRALSSLRTYLHRSAVFSELELLKLWKGLFFCMWMSDKPLTQQRLARDLAELLTVLKGGQNFLGFVDAFWKTMAREWGGIEALRMDKFLYLVRCYVGKGFECVAKREWADEELIDDYLAILTAVPLNVRDTKIPNGLRYHVIDVYVDELDKADTERTVPLVKILAPLRKLGKDSFTKAVRTRVQEALDDDRLLDWTNVGAEREEDSAAATAEQANSTADGASEMDEDEISDDGEFGGFED
ncbi:hypothetical protein LTR37_021370 [Vermiconidia calcicola]|uniref:Uncharacterized protein n=1 Tax=Vermiconidia calcicola TaxID=1690605 RepID=A0ACC3M8W2_9PEZI|nr:hypothetical protein LTR37_021370 [Vermiconidia calcicola]